MSDTDLIDLMDLEGYSEYSSLQASPSSPTHDSLPDSLLSALPHELIDHSELKRQAIANRRDEPINYKARSPSKTQADSSNDKATIITKETPKPRAELQQSNRQLRARVKYENKADSISVRQDSINKISTPTPPIDLVKTHSKTQDLELMALASQLEVFSLNEIQDYQIVSPTSAEFISQYYRLIHIMVTKITLSQLVLKPRPIRNLWDDGISEKTPNISSNTSYFYDAVYRYCVQDSIIISVRMMYKNKRIHFTKMNIEQVMGAGSGISSAQQATIFLEKLASSSVSVTLGALSFRANMTNTKNWFTQHFGKTEYGEVILKMIQKAVTEASKAHAVKYEDDNTVYVAKGHHCLLFAKKLLNRHASYQISNAKIQHSALVFLFSGVEMDEPRVGNIGLDPLANALNSNSALMASLVNISYQSSRHCYPIDELSHL